LAGPSLVHMAAKMPAKMMMKIGLMDWTQLGGMDQPNNDRSSRWSEYSAMTVNCCWNSDQKTALAMNIGINDSTRLRSCRVIL